VNEDQLGVKDRRDCVVAVVDDDPRLRESLENLLSSAGFEVRSFESAEVLLIGTDLEVSWLGWRPVLCRPIGIRIVYGHVVVSQG
jgi:hypothetical protein